ncbi:MAG: substrate-binding domain-containing protein [Bacillota bacterium]
MQPDYRLLIDRDSPGRFERLCTLLAQVEQLGSLRRATEALSTSYRYAWGLIRKAEEAIGAPLLVSKAGGAGGGGAELTPVAHDLLRRHRLLQQELSSILGPGARHDTSDPVLMASTIGPVEAGLVDALVTAYREQTGAWVRYIAAGSGQALVVARSGRVDLVLTHAPDLEEQFIQEGYGTRRYPLACNSFLLCGPAADPAFIAGAGSAPEALRRIAVAGAPFVSRADQSGTHVKEMQLWAAAGIAPAGPWYEVWPLGGQGNAATLRHAVSTGAYTLIDSATFTIVQPPGYAVLCRADPLLRNLFTLIPVHPGRFPKANHAGAARFIAWATGPEGRAVISSFGVRAHGLPLFQLPDPCA